MLVVIGIKPSVAHRSLALDLPSGFQSLGVELELSLAASVCSWWRNPLHEAHFESLAPYLYNPEVDCVA